LKFGLFVLSEVVLCQPGFKKAHFLIVAI